MQIWVLIPLLYYITLHCITLHQIMPDERRRKKKKRKKVEEEEKKED